MNGNSGEKVTLEKAEYAALLEDRRLLLATRDILLSLLQSIDPRSPPAMRAVTSVPPMPGYGGVSPIDRDAELAAFIRPLLGVEKLVGIADLCRERFGADRAPSKSAIHRFWKRSDTVRRSLEDNSKASPSSA